MHGGATFADTDYDKLGANVFGEGSIQFFFKSRSRQGEYNIAKEIAVSNNVYSDGNLFCVQHSSWQTEKKAKSVAQTLIKEGYNAFVVAANIPQWSQIRYRVRVGYYNTLDEARKIAAKFR